MEPGQGAGVDRVPEPGERTGVAPLVTTCFGPRTAAAEFDGKDLDSAPDHARSSNRTPQGHNRLGRGGPGRVRRSGGRQSTSLAVPVGRAARTASVSRRRVRRGRARRRILRRRFSSRILEDREFPPEPPAMSANLQPVRRQCHRVRRPAGRRPPARSRLREREQFVIAMPFAVRSDTWGARRPAASMSRTSPSTPSSSPACREGRAPVPQSLGGDAGGDETSEADNLGAAAPSAPGRRRARCRRRPAAAPRYAAPTAAQAVCLTADREVNRSPVIRPKYRPRPQP